MTNNISIKVIAFGNNELLSNLDGRKLEPRELFDPIESDEDIRIIRSYYKSGYTEDIIELFIKELEGLSMFIEIDGEPSFSSLLYKDKNSKNLLNLFEIEDYCNDDFFINFNTEYFKNFDKIHLDRFKIKYLRKTQIGKTYTNLLINPTCYK